MIYDVSIIGGGPAATAAAIVCARGGLRCRILTPMKGRNTAAFLKVPSRVMLPVESMHPGVESLLRHLGISSILDQTSRGSYSAILMGGVPRPLSPDPYDPWQGIHICRSDFDRLLLESCRATSVETVHSTPICGIEVSGQLAEVRTTGGETFVSRWVIDGTGRRALLGGLLRLERRLLSPPLIAWTGVAPAPPGSQSWEHPRFLPEAHGWTWMTQPIEGSVTWTRLMPTRRSDPAPPMELQSESASNAHKAANVQWRIFKGIAAQGFVLAGDAAGMLDPACGQGVLNALYSGIRAATCIVQCVHNPVRTTSYLREYDDWFTARFETMAGTLRGFYTDLGVDPDSV